MFYAHGQHMAGLILPAKENYAQHFLLKKLFMNNF